MASLASKKAKKSKKSKSSSSSSSSSTTASSSANSIGRTKNIYDVTKNEVTLNVKPGQHNYPSKHFLSNFKDNFSINVLKREDDRIEFEMLGIDCSIANAFRRILISEVSTVAIETIYLHNNTSIVQDEVLAHRLGLIPIDVEPDDFKDLERQPDGTVNRTDDNTLVFTMNVTCSAKPGRKPGRIDPDYDDLLHGVVYSSDLTWVPQGNQAERYRNQPKQPKTFHDDIIIAKLRPGQSIHLEAHCNRGIGKDHAKFSPVYTASYRLMPKICIYEKEDESTHHLLPVYDDRAELLMKLMPNVFQLVQDQETGRMTVKVVSPRNCTMSRNFMSEDDLAKSVTVQRVPDHFIFSIETVGAIPPEDLLPRALTVLVEKCNNVLDGIESF